MYIGCYEMENAKGSFIWAQKQTKQKNNREKL